MFLAGLDMASVPVAAHVASRGWLGSFCTTGPVEKSTIVPPARPSCGVPAWVTAGCTV